MPLVKRHRLGDVMEDPFESLSSAQRDCLRWVAKGHKSKGIARITGFAPSTIDTYLSKAASTLGVASRREAAMRFVQWEQECSGKFGFSGFSGAVAIVGDENPPNIEPTTRATASYETSKSFIAGLLPPPIGGRENDLKTADRFLAACKIAFLGAVVLIAVALILRKGLEAFS